MNTMLMAHVPYKHLFSLLIMFNLPVSLPTTSVVCFSFIWQIPWSLLDFLVLITMCLVYSSQHSLLALLISVFEDHAVSMLAQVIADVVSSTLQATKWESPSLLASSPPPFCKSMTMVHDTVLFTSLCFLLEKNIGHIQVTCTDQSNTIEAWCEIHDCSCVMIKPKYRLINFSKFVSLGASEDFDMMVITPQTTKRFCTWYYQYDVVCIF